MMDGIGKSDLAIVAVKPTNKAVCRLRSRWSQGRGPRGTRTSKARAGHRAGNRVTGAGRVRQVSQDIAAPVKHPRWEPSARIRPVRMVRSKTG